MANWWTEIGPSKEKQTYEVCQTYLGKILVKHQEQNAVLRQVLIGKHTTTNKKMANKIRYGHYKGDLHILTKYIWKDGANFTE
jgi:hypothetical protein